jgi:translation elongation factor EF-Ts
VIQSRKIIIKNAAKMEKKKSIFDIIFSGKMDKKYGKINLNC